MNFYKEIELLILILRHLTRLDMTITSTIFKNGIEELPNDSKMFENIGRKIYELHGIEQSFFNEGSTLLAEYIENIINLEDNSSDLTILDELFEISLADEDEVETMINNLLNKIKDIDVYNTLKENNTIPNHFTADYKNWRNINSNTVGYILDQKIYHHYGVFVPTKFLKIIYSNYTNINTERKDIRLFYKRKIYTGYIAKTFNGYIISWDNQLRRRINKKFPKYFSLDSNIENSSESIIMTFYKHENFDDDYFEIGFLID